MPPCKTALAATCAVIVVGCTLAPPARDPVALTSARVAARYQETEAEHELAAGEVSQALATTARIEAISPVDPWVHYDRAVALDKSGRMTEAAAEYREAETRFTGRTAWGKAISIYGRAHALATAGRCAEAKPAYDEFAAYIRRINPEQAEMAARYATDCAMPSAPADPRADAAATAVVAGDYAGALAVARADGRGWAEYNRAVALAALHRTDEAVAAFRVAERTLGAGRERAIAIYGRARALDNSHRCGEASRAYGEYAAVMRPTHPRDADMALAYARDCGEKPRQNAGAPRASLLAARSR